MPKKKQGLNQISNKPIPAFTGALKIPVIVIAAFAKIPPGTAYPATTEPPN